MTTRENLPMHYGASAILFERARLMRINATEAEKRMWELLSSPTFRQFKFRRQHPLHTYIADFYSHPLKLVVEVDGEYHSLKEQVENDRLRDEVMNNLNLRVIRFSNEQVLSNCDLVAQQLLTQIEQLL